MPTNMEMIVLLFFLVFGIFVLIYVAYPTWRLIWEEIKGRRYAKRLFRHLVRNDRLLLKVEEHEGKIKISAAAPLADPDKDYLLFCGLDDDDLLYTIVTANLHPDSADIESKVDETIKTVCTEAHKWAKWTQRRPRPEKCNAASYALAVSAWMTTRPNKLPKVSVWEYTTVYRPDEWKIVNSQGKEVEWQ